MQPWDLVPFETKHMTVEKSNSRSSETPYMKSPIRSTIDQTGERRLLAGSPFSPNTKPDRIILGFRHHRRRSVILGRRVSSEQNRHFQILDLAAEPRK